MTHRCIRIVCAGLLLTMIAPRPALADHHFVQIQKLIAGVNGYTGLQVIQLRMRSDFQGHVTGKKLVARDAAGLNPVVLITCEHDVFGDAVGARILFATDNLQSFTTPVTAPDFVLTNRIPDSYLPAGCITWEDEVGTVWWRVCWGGAAYTGPTDVNVVNDANGNCAPPWSGALPSTTLQALQYLGPVFGVSNTNLADYGVSAGAATFTNNANANTTLILPPTSAQRRSGALDRIIAAPNPFSSSTRMAFHLSRGAPARFSVLDVTGRRIASQAATLDAGEHFFEWHAQDSGGNAVPAGVYFLELEVEGRTRGMPVVLIR